ncbi:uncharacterized protein ALTATR162_LOCUS325 [Alternaria atra]|uniref:Heterokaryon incompatibility domain-containing protein n=1 Tax=Alternaria atra TaxID=119953 RepID=A0A8J2HRR0_9PLEO|nr:uncharacterized protein ALTATR162_LOCUS325 [Alternaria atra]CAG5138365.1 unnamed protein product [Alternaria atra]
MPHMPKTPTYYWIDFLCMNQSNIEERNAQVARMADVFKKADGVVVWLGKEDQYTQDALTTMRRISATPEKDGPLVPYTSFYNPEESQLVSSTRLTFHNWLGFIVLINRPWFKRAWVIQEIALGKTALVVCGNKVFPWDILSKTLSFVKTTRWYHHLHAEKLKHVKELRKHPGIYKQILKSKLEVGISPLNLNSTRLTASSLIEPNGQAVKQPSFRNLLDKHRFAESSDPRDKVYAFLGLANRNLSPFRTQPNALVPDYNLSVEEVFIEIATVLMSSYKNLSWLSHVEDLSQRRISGLPSWVPDLSVPLQPYPLRYRGPAYWAAAGNRAWRPDVASMEKGLLRVQGIQLDRVDQTSMLIDESEDPSAAWASIVNLALSLNFPYPDPGATGKTPSRVEELENWYLNTVVDPSIAPHVADIHLDGETTNRQQVLFPDLKRKEFEPTVQPHYDENDVWINYHKPTDKECVYDRTLELYSARQNYIQEEGVRRLSVWLDWYAEKMKPEPLRDESVVAACQSTILFLKDDYLKRKVDFATEVYAVLDKGDTKSAKMVVDDLVELFPWLKKDFCGRLMNSVVAYDGLKNKLSQV